MAEIQVPVGEDPGEPGAVRSVAPALVLMAAAATLLLRERLQDLLDGPGWQTWSTVFVSVVLQALPFLVLGSVVSGLIAILVPAGAIEQLLPRNRVLAVPAAGIAGIALPGCECGSVPVAGRLVAAGAPSAAALTFMLAAPAINPVVLVATAVAFPGRPAMVVARLAASLLAAVVVGWVWIGSGRGEDLVARARRRHTPNGTSKLEALSATVMHDLLHAGGYLVVGAITAATLRTAVPDSVLDTVAGHAVIAVAALAVLAVVMAVCSEADAFVAASLTQVSDTAKLVFLVVGPMVDVKLVALQVGTFGPRFAARFAPLAFLVAVVSAVLVAAVLLR